MAKKLVIKIDEIVCHFFKGKMIFFAPSDLDIVDWKRMNNAEIKHYKNLTYNESNFTKSNSAGISKNPTK